MREVTEWVWLCRHGVCAGDLGEEGGACGPSFSWQGFPIHVMYGGRRNGLWPPGVISSVPAASGPLVLSSSAGNRVKKKKDTMRQFLFKKSLMLNCIKTWSFLSSKGTTKRIKKASEYERGKVCVCFLYVCIFSWKLPHIQKVYNSYILLGEIPNIWKEKGQQCK